MAQEGSIRSIINLLDSEEDELPATAAAVLANMSYWSSNGVGRVHRFQIFCAL